ncbi:BREX-1 system phosphatase PglZ type A [Magnetospirillum moscoviense]|uniref:Uncharacterized protein n=1 Tax=Magnetospirillum moscoviense TaxID=1437059 RepID=A0A178M6W4_9PROT|nr:BREX-1 system phosphatase PglZ type A [Magnetospirillum moscoviense]OAN44501.1 hypothetical protein A6A05_04885 [Magnetospirillum moscoviense]
MNEDQISEALLSLYGEGNRIVFWNDPDREFEESLTSLDLDGVTLLRADQIPGLEAKIRMEREQPESRFLVYSATHVPLPSEDWLLDIRLYSRTFRADRASIILGELGLQEQSLHSHIQARAKFLGSKDRLTRLKKLVQPTDSIRDLDRKMLAVVTKVDQPEFLGILTALYHAIPDSDLDALPPAWDEIEKYDLLESFWSMVQGQFGYSESFPTLKNLLIRLMVSDFAHSITAELPAALAHLMLPRLFLSSASVCLSQWRDSNSRSDSYDRLSKMVGDALKIDSLLPGMQIEPLLDNKTFLVVEKFIAVSLRDRVTATTATINAEAVKSIAKHRQNGYWADRNRGAIGATREALHAVYDALIAAADLFGLRGEFSTGFDYNSAKAMFDGYATTLHQFDRLYRHFIEAADAATAQGWEILKSLRDGVEDCYTNWFLTNVSLKWGKFVEDELLKEWRVEGVIPQPWFFHKVEAALMESDRRVFVIISDALRYEAAKELVDVLNGTYRIQAEIQPMLGVLPSYTALGMAALLPHSKISYSDKGDVLVDGQSSAAGNRSNILAQKKGVAVKADDLKDMKKDAGREFVKPYEVVYVYHNTIDAIGDSGSTEGKTFEAVRQALTELSDLIRMIMNNLNGTYIYVTADHGFLFQETALDASDKNALTDKPSGALTAKKRYLLGRNLPDSAKAYHGSTAITAGADGDMEFWVPKGNNRFHFVGGSRFVHGGAMLQEITVPLIRVRQIKGDAKSRTSVKNVGVMVTTQSPKITTNRYRFELMQTEKATDRVKPATLDIAVYEGGQAITNIERVTFDSTQDNLDSWKKSVWLSLQKRSYDKKGCYHLILRNAEDGIEVQRVEVSISIAFMDDF